MLFVQVILPVFLITAAGFVFARKSGADLQSLANSVLYLFAPSLVFSALIKSHVESDMLARLALFMTLYTALLCLLAVANVGFLGLDGLTRKIVILQTSTPSAVLPLLYTIRFGTRPDLVSGTILFSTLCSAFTLTALLYCLG